MSRERRCSESGQRGPSRPSLTCDLVARITVSPLYVVSSLNHDALLVRPLACPIRALTECLPPLLPARLCPWRMMVSVLNLLIAMMGKTFQDNHEDTHRSILSANLPSLPPPRKHSGAISIGPRPATILARPLRQRAPGAVVRGLRLGSERPEPIAWSSTRFHRTGAVAITLPAIPLTLALHALAFASTSCRRRSGLAIVAVSQGVALVRERGPSDVCLVDCENGWRQRAWPQTCVHAVAGRTWFFPFARQVSIYLSLCSSSLSLSLSMFLSFSSASYFVSYLCQAESALPCSFPSFSSFAL